MRYVILAIVLCGFWVVFSHQLKPFYIGTGLFSVILTVALMWRIDIPKSTISWRFIYRFPLYLFWLAYQAVKESTIVAIQIWRIKPNIQPQFVEVKSVQKTDLGFTILSNSITLTPGTVSISIDKNKALSHALMDMGAAGLNEGDMDKKIARLVA